MFQAQFVAVMETQEKGQLVKQDLSWQPVRVQDLARQTLVWALALQRQGVFPREDYAELLQLVIFHLGGEVDTVWPLRMPSSDHQVRWMGNCIYYLKKLVCSKVFPLDTKELGEVESIAEFVVLFRAMSWFECRFDGAVAVLDLKFLCHIQL